MPTRRIKDGRRSQMTRYSPSIPDGTSVDRHSDQPLDPLDGPVERIRAVVWARALDPFRPDLSATSAQVFGIDHRSVGPAGFQPGQKFLVYRVLGIGP